MYYVQFQNKAHMESFFTAVGREADEIDRLLLVVLINDHEVDIARQHGGVVYDQIENVKFQEVAA